MFAVDFVLELLVPEEESLDEPLEPPESFDEPLEDEAFAALVDDSPDAELESFDADESESLLLDVLEPLPARLSFR